MSWWTQKLLFSASLTFVYLWKLSNRLRGRPGRQIEQKHDLSQVEYDHVDLLASIPKNATSQGYAVIGGSGFLGSYIIRLLVLRGETNIRVLDINPPSETVASYSSVSFIKTDITSLDSVRQGLTLPFRSTGAPPSIIFHTAAAIRFWERLGYCWQASYNINVLGLENVIKVAQELPSAVLIYTSTADTVVPRPRFLRLGLDMPGESVAVSDLDETLSHSQLSESCYTRSKLLAEKLVSTGDGLGSLRTGIIRPGYTIIGPNDRLVTSTLLMPRVPVFDKGWSSTNVCVWDAAAAHLLLEHSLTQNVKEARGQAFLITGKDPSWRLQDTREAVKYFATRTVTLDDMPVLLVFILAHLVEIFLFLRYHLLSLLLLPVRRTPTLIPQWMGQLVYLQPATLEYLSDIIIDDIRARKILGYRAQWSTAQSIRYAVEELESGKTSTSHGLQLKASYVNQ